VVSRTRGGGGGPALLARAVGGEVTGQRLMGLEAKSEVVIEILYVSSP